jgi:ribosomal protein S18 acetylase RimI-like enzyme
LKINIKRAQTSDFLGIAELDREVWSHYKQTDFNADGEHIWRVWIEHALVFCAKDENAQIVGAIVAFPIISSQYFLHKIFVDLNHRGRGIATKMLGLLLAEIDRMGAKCILTVDPNNEAAIHLYKKFGFFEKEFVKGYYKHNEDRFVLKRKSH